MRILNAEYLKTIAGQENREGMPIHEVCFMGRSNVGKSSLINALVGRKIARTSSTPGATRSINLYKVHYEYGGTRKWLILSDFPGFGYSKVPKGTYDTWERLVEGYIVANPSIRRLLWIFDVRREPDRLDEMLIEWLTYRRLSYTTVVTKIDKVGHSYVAQKKEYLRRALGCDDIFLFSSKDGYGRKELLSHIFSLIE
jgi:GTP-binding protein